MCRHKIWFWPMKILSLVVLLDKNCEEIRAAFLLWAQNLAHVWLAKDLKGLGTGNTVD